jgi:cellulose synthase/poly-beta-1,6-N-acetylglucosamine synthase-like glycosyltransferase
MVPGWLEVVFLVPLALFLSWSAYYTYLGLKGSRLSRLQEVGTPGAPEDGGQLPRVSLIIPAKNEAAVVEEAILQALSFRYPPELKEIIVVEDGSIDSTPEVCRRYAERYSCITLVQGGESQGKPAALNRAVPYIHGDVVGFLDADARAQPDLLLRVASFLEENPDIDALQAIPQTLQGKENLITRLDSFETSLWYDHIQRAKDRLGLFVHLCGSGMFLRRSTLEELGCWDDSCLGEDVEYSTRMARAGKRMRLAPIKIWRQPPYSPRAFLRQRMRWWGGVFQILGRNLGAIGGHKGMPLAMRIDMYLHLLSPVILIISSLSLVAFLALLFLSNPSPEELQAVLVAGLVANGVMGVVVTATALARRDPKGILLWPGLYFYWLLQLTAIFAVGLRLLVGAGMPWEATPKRRIPWRA